MPEGSQVIHGLVHSLKMSEKLCPRDFCLRVMVKLEARVMTTGV